MTPHAVTTARLMLVLRHMASLVCFVGASLVAFSSIYRTPSSDVAFLAVGLIVAGVLQWPKIDVHYYVPRETESYGDTSIPDDDGGRSVSTDIDPRND